ncbi:MAG TPA: hypothetical protein PLX30_02090 [Methanothrix sp.]|nr:hypothetical protein [Methanothrix sp.]
MIGSEDIQRGEIMEDEELMPLPEELEEAWKSIELPFGGLFGNTVFMRVLREIVADPYREFRPKDLEILTSASPPMIGESLQKLESFGLLVKGSNDSQRPFYRANLESQRLIALTFLAYAVNDDRDANDDMAVAVKDYCDLIYGPSVTENITVVFSEDYQKSTGVETYIVSESTSQVVHISSGATAE